MISKNGLAELGGTDKEAAGPTCGLVCWVTSGDLLSSSSGCESHTEAGQGTTLTQDFMLLWVMKVVQRRVIVKTGLSWKKEEVGWQRCCLKTVSGWVNLELYLLEFLMRGWALDLDLKANYSSTFKLKKTDTCYDMGDYLCYLTQMI